MKDTSKFDMAPLKDIRVKEPQFGRVRTPQVLMGRDAKNYQKGDILDANATVEAIQNALMDMGLDTDEHVTVNLKIDDMKSLAGKTVSVVVGGNVLYYNISQVGQVEFVVPKGTQYSIKLPIIDGYIYPSNYSFTAASGNRIVDFEYKVEEIVEEEHVKIICIKHSLHGTSEAIENVKLLDNRNFIIYESKAEGEINFTIKYGSRFRAVISRVDGYYLYNLNYVIDIVGSIPHRYIRLDFYEESSGVSIISKDGEEYLIDDWSESGKPSSEAALIKLQSAMLRAKNRIIYLNPQELLSITKKVPCSSDEFTYKSLKYSATLNDAVQRYDGKECCEAILEESNNYGESVPAFEYAKSKTTQVAGKTLYGYIGAAGECLEFFNNLDEIEAAVNLIFGDDSCAYIQEIMTSTFYNKGYLWDCYNDVSIGSRFGYVYVEHRICVFYTY